MRLVARALLTQHVVQVGFHDGAYIKQHLPSSRVQVWFPAFKPGKYQHVNLASFSSRGLTSDGILKPEVVCPGHAIVSACSDGDTSNPQCGSSIADNNFEKLQSSNGAALTKQSGTSMATPACSGKKSNVISLRCFNYIFTVLIFLNPFLAGAATIVRQYFRSGYWHRGLRNDSMAFTPSAALIKAVLINGYLYNLFSGCIRAEPITASS